MLEDNRRKLREAFQSRPRTSHLQDLVNAMLQQELERMIREHTTSILNEHRQANGPTNTPYRPSVSITSNTPAQTLPIGNNEKLLEEKNITVPKEFECPLSCQIMTNPVYFKNLTSKNIQCFEYDWIIEHLEKNQKHPITREAVSKEMLVPNVSLKIAIDDFVKRKTQLTPG